MFELHPVLWLQSFESTALTAAMNVVSLLGYTRACVAIGIFLAFGLRMRPAVALLVVLGLASALTDMAKAAAEAPRPDRIAVEVQALSWYAEQFREREADTPTEVEDSYGFPSGHVSTTTAFAVGLAMLFGWRRRGWTAVVAWVGLMAISRMYLGRHFFGDVVGGVLVGLAAVALGFGVLKLREPARELRAQQSWPAHRVMAVALVLAGGALLLGLPDAGDAGRLLGTAIGILVLIRHDVFEFAQSRRARAILVVVAALAFAAAWGVMALALRAADPSSVSALRLAASTLPNAAVLIVPALVPRRLLAGPLSPSAARAASGRP